ncbi:C-type lectin domain family 10 member A-like [Periophthalmus magnuspinnatus]|uniref:C-type lectin domain family 10 member A-like n=1 Tax=Periophthalmus magnuspinnatus TaxID=409849 RepID=UPI00145A85E8|nr:C-type lectin domain family 10 member A-like [Periophthalmus magnuspinnatus]
MSTQFHDEPDEDDNSSFWNKDPGPVQYSVWSRYRRWLIPGLITTFILILILAFGVSNSGLASRLGFVEESALNLSLSLINAQKETKDAAKGVQRLSFSVESNKDQLNSVAESLKQLSQLEVLSKTVAALKCAVDQLIHNKTAASGCCPLEWDTFETSCFLFSKVSMSWHEARDWCHAHQSQLLILNADKDWDYVASRTSGVHYWIGLTDEGGKWEWVNGTPYTIDRRRWRPGQPDNWEGHGMGAGTEDCAHLHSEGRLNDMHCLVRLRFICHKRS